MNEVYIKEVVALYFDGYTVDAALKKVKEMIKEEKLKNVRWLNE